ncbi:MAG: FIST C-terminal domain-containing protein [Gammaproteobacteria bacterium]|nr:FIST C-terminal domain-containing protein [Gammaproteobacteria bacterium]
MKPFHYAHAAASDWRQATESCIEQLGSVPETASLGFLYVTDALSPHLGDILKHLRQRTPVLHWVGSVGIGICATGVEYYEEPALAIMLGEFGANSFRVFSGVTTDIQALDTSHGAWIREHQPYFGVVHADPRNHRTEVLVEELCESLQTGFLVGGLASSREAFRQVADEVTEGGLSGVLFSSSVSVSTRLTQGCSPIGPLRQITGGERNVIAALDGRPAVEVFKEDIGEVLARDLSRTAGYIFAGLPVEGSDTGDYLVRNLVGIEPEKGYVAIGELIEPGQRLMFCRRDAETAREDLFRMLGELRESMPETPRGGLYFSCLGRGTGLFGPDSAELKIVQEVFGELPVVGFYANGEISHDRLYGYTGVLTLFL